MSRAAEVRLKWPDKERLFRLRIAQLRELQEKTGAGPKELFDRVSIGAWRVDDIRETIRLGLIGGEETTVIEALNIVERYVDDRPLAENVPVAQAILLAAIVGVEDERLGGNRPARKKTAKTAAGSASQTSTETAPSSAGTPEQ